MIFWWIYNFLDLKAFALAPVLSFPVDLLTVVKVTEAFEPEWSSKRSCYKTTTEPTESVTTLVSVFLMIGWAIIFDFLSRSGLSVDFSNSKKEIRVYLHIILELCHKCWILCSEYAVVKMFKYWFLLFCCFRFLIDFPCIKSYYKWRIKKPSSFEY